MENKFMGDKTYTEVERDKISNIMKITRAVAAKYEVRGVYKIIENSPAGRKCSYQERVAGDAPLENLFGGCLLVCPKGDRTNGEAFIEINAVGNRIKMIYTHNCTRDEEMPEISEDHNMKRLDQQQEIRDCAARLQKIYRAELDLDFEIHF